MDFSIAFTKITYLPKKVVNKVKVLCVYITGKFWGIQDSAVGLLALIWNCLRVEGD